ncbi:MAG TPA: 2-C-methyl-D-erythritol 2,4-cyclodiphosphate synthase [Candidatus Acidoferrum sp.]|nr:2-C-methyl-D-erythritol 2,4-cyclodiphosphate synthase [Candidatus Acidoferrum sp.]
MLERFTEHARRVIFFARYEASHYGCPSIESFHIILGLAREDRVLFRKFKTDLQKLSELYERLYPERNPPIATSVEVPLSAESKRILQKAADEADKFGQRHVGPEHLLLAATIESTQVREELGKLGITESTVLESVKDFSRRMQVGDLSRKFENFFSAGIAPRTGIGYDLHRLEPGRKLIVGGVEIPFDKGSVGHSDGDVLIHAICDALLGSAALGDIGAHFPDTDPKWKGAKSLDFLTHLSKVLDEKNIYIFHIDAVVILERPKLGPHFPAMREAIAKALGMQPDQINLKAKTNEGVDAIGRGEAIAAYAVATIAG